MINFSAWSIKSPIPSMLLFVMLTLAGIWSFQRLTVQNMPDFDLPTVTISISLPGAAPSQMETEVTRLIEDSVASIGNIEHISSTVTDGYSITIVEFVLEKDVNQAVDDVRDAVNRVRSDLPADVREPMIARVNVAGGAISTYTVSSKRMDDAELSWFVDNDISKAVLGVPGIGKVSRIGGIAREISVEIDPAQLQALNVTAASVSRQLRNVQLEASGGRTNIGGSEQSLRTLGKVTSVQDLKNLSIPLTDGRNVRLDRVARIEDGPGEQRQIALLDGKPVVGFEVYRAQGASEVDVSAEVDAALKKMEAQHDDIKIKKITTSVTKVKESYEGSMTMLIEGAILAVIVVWLFLRDFRATFISAIALPLSIIPTFLIMYVLGYTLNTVTLLALSLVVGILVDDAIVEVENIVRHLRMGKKPLQAAMEAADEIGLAVIATTFTLVSVFLPTAFMSGIPGKFFKQFGWTAALAVLFSLLVARLLTPMMAAYGLKADTPHAKDGAIMNWYLRTARTCLKRRGLTLSAAIVFFLASLYMASFLPKGFLPPSVTDYLNVTVELPPGTQMKNTLATTEKVRQAVQNIPEIANVYTAIGATSTRGGPGGGSSAGDVRKGSMILNFVPDNKRDREQKEIEADVRKALSTIPGARFTVGGAGRGEKFSIVLSGDDAAVLNGTAQNVARDLRSVPGLGNVTSSASLLRPEIVIRPDPQRMADLGVTTSDIGETLRVTTAGDFDTVVPKFDLAERQLYIRVRIPETARSNLDLLRQLRVPSRNGTVPLENVASITSDSGASEISRYDRGRNVTLQGELGGVPLGEMMKKVDKLSSLQKLPPGVTRENSGELERMQQLFSSFGTAMLFGILCVYCVLVLLFKDFMQPVTILAALPLSIGGAFGLLLITGYSLSLPTLIGLIALMGIVTKNSILLVEYAIMIQRQENMPVRESLLEACHKRARPIVMTTIAMSAGMLPVALGFEGDASFRAPMAVAVIGGLLTSTLLSLLVVPVVYTYVYDFEAWLKRKWRKPS